MFLISRPLSDDDRKSPGSQADELSDWLAELDAMLAAIDVEG